MTLSRKSMISGYDGTFTTCTIPQYTSFTPPKILHNHCLQVLLREIKNNAYANFWGLKRCIMGFMQVVNWTFC